MLSVEQTRYAGEALLMRLWWIVAVTLQAIFQKCFDSFSRTRRLP
jgi:hypothetical protein